jgi:hypothetical protein
MKKSKERIQSEQQIFHLLINIVEQYPQYTFSQHLCHLLRKQSERVETYFWADELLLKKIENYYDELTIDLANNIDEESYD